MPDDLGWSWDSNNWNKVHNKCNVFESPQNHPPTSSPWKNCLPQNPSLVQKVWGLLLMEHLTSWVVIDHHEPILSLVDGNSSMVEQSPSHLHKNSRAWASHRDRTWIGVEGTFIQISYCCCCCSHSCTFHPSMHLSSYLFRWKPPPSLMRPSFNSCWVSHLQNSRAPHFSSHCGQPFLSSELPCLQCEPQGSALRDVLTHVMSHWKIGSNLGWEHDVSEPSLYDLLAY